MYRKQYLTPTMILFQLVRKLGAGEPRAPYRRTHHRIVKTTPNPSATKKSRGDELLLLLGVLVGVLVGSAAVVLATETVADPGGPGVDDVPTKEVVDDTKVEAVVDAACLKIILAPSTTAGLIKAMSVHAFLPFPLTDRCRD